MGKLKIQGKEVQTDILDDTQKASIVDYVNRKSPYKFPLGIDLKFDNSGGLTISFEDKAWYVGAKMTSEVPKQATSCDSIEEALYKCVKAWNNSKTQQVGMPDVLSERNIIREMKQRSHRNGRLSTFNTLKKTQKFYNPPSLSDISVIPKPPSKPRKS